MFSIGKYSGSATPHTHDDLGGFIRLSRVICVIDWWKRQWEWNGSWQMNDWLALARRSFSAVKVLSIESGASIWPSRGRHSKEFSRKYLHQRSCDFRWRSPRIPSECRQWLFLLVLITFRVKLIRKRVSNGIRKIAQWATYWPRLDRWVAMSSVPHHSLSRRGCKNNTFRSTYLCVNVDWVRCRSVDLQFRFAILSDLSHERHCCSEILILFAAGHVVHFEKS